jgi:glycosyltransferase involved in cell wall biosynthesis
MKDHSTFLEAAALLLRERSSVQFVMAGKGVDVGNRELFTAVARLGLEKAVHLLGEVPAMHDLTASLDIACSSSAYGEAFPSVLGEAMACGVPCITTDVGDSSWIVGDAGRVVPPRDPKALAAACAALVDMGAEVRRHVGEAGRSRVLREFSLEATAARYDDIYSGLLGSGIGR